MRDEDRRGSASTDDGLALLDRGQRVVAEAESSARLIVLAAPGSGKTQVVAARVTALGESHDLDVVDEIIVLSFSRAAVAALRGRMSKGAVGTLPTIRTIDSFASMLLEERDAEDWREQDYEERIRRATTLLRENRSELVSLLRHVVIDEVQDLVGRRADFVLSLLKALPQDAGFTLLGDPRQALYGFQSTDTDDLRGDAFVAEAMGLHGVEPVRQNRLSGQYRARSVEASAVAALGASDLTASSWESAVREQLDSVLTVEDISGIARPVTLWGGTTAVLCRTNGDALVVAGRMRELDVSVSVRPRAEAILLDAWVARAVGGGPRILKRDDVFYRGHGEDIIDPNVAWRLLKATERNYRVPDQIDVQRLAARVASGNYPAALAARGGPIVVSTVHRAKGLEFDHAVLVDPDAMKESDETAVAYVALTRARDRLIGVGLTRPRYLKLDRTLNRWVVGGHRSWMTAAIELRPEDIVPDVDFGEGGHDLQGPVTARFDRRASTLEVPIWELRWDDRPLGRTTVHFGASVARRVKAGTVRGNWGWADLAGAGVDGVVTAPVSDVNGRPLLKLVPSVSGLVTFER